MPPVEHKINSTANACLEFKERVHEESGDEVSQQLKPYRKLTHKF